MRTDTGLPVEGEAAELLQRSILSVNGDGPNALQTLIREGILDDSGEQGALQLRSGGQGASGDGTGDGQSQRLDVYVEPDLKCAIEPSLKTYVADLKAEGYSATVIPFEGSAEDLREQLQCRWQQGKLDGAFFIGDLPYLDLTTEDNFSADSPYETTYPHDLYFMDLDGTYTLSDFGVDQHTGDVEPEIYVSRLTASTLSGLTGLSEEDLINGYFDKLHAFRTGKLDFDEKGIVFADDDWAATEVGALGPLYADVTEIRDPAETTLDRYVDVLGQNAETVIEFLHSWPQGHVVSGDGGGLLFSEDILKINPDLGFINMFNCSSADFTEDGNLIGAYLLGGDNVLNAVGSTKTGSMLNFNQFYGPQAQGQSFGDAYRQWFEGNAAPTDDPSRDWHVDWFYGMTMQGDPTLSPTAEYQADHSCDLIA